MRITFVIISLLTLAASLPALGDANVNPATPEIPNRNFNLRDFGGVGDAKTLNTAAFAKAIQALASKNGGRLDVPAGIFLTQPFSLTSHLELHLVKGAVIQFPADLIDYGLSAAPSSSQVKKFKERCQALISGNNLTDIAITGDGIIDGSGAAWWNLTAVGKNGQRHSDTSFRPKLILLTDVRRLAVQGVTLQNSPRYHLALTQCQDAIIDGLHIISPGESPHTDGIDPIASSSVLIRNCDLDVGDDNIAVKAIGGQAAHILIENCHCEHGRGISIGSETYDGIHDVTIRNCAFDGTTHGIHIKSARDRGNDLSHFDFSHIVMKNVPEPLIINLYYEDREGAADRSSGPITATTPFLHDIHITDLTATGAATAGEIIGLPESPVKQVTLTNVTISAQTGMKIIDAQGVALNHVQINTQSGDPLTSDHADVSWPVH